MCTMGGTDGNLLLRVTLLYLPETTVQSKNTYRHM